MKNLLMISYWFPPEGNAATYRPLRFVRHLDEYGWRADVIACGGQHRYERYDPDLLQKVPPDCRIFRADYFDPWQSFKYWKAGRLQQNGQAKNTENGRRNLVSSSPVQRSSVRSTLTGIVRQLESVIYHPDLHMFWIRPAVGTGLQAARLCSYNAIWATGPPWSSFVAARKISEQTGIPYVLDFRCSWTVVPYDFYARRPEWLQRKERRRLASLFEKAHSIVFFYEAEAECFWRMYRAHLDPSRIYIIPNGFEGVVREFDAPPRRERCRILYTGVISDYRYDSLLEGLQLFKKKYPLRAAKLSFEFVGEGYAAFLEKASAVGVDDLVQVSAPVAYSEVSRLERNCHALLILGRPSSRVGHDLQAGAKLFGYMNAGRPILGVLPDDETKRILREIGVMTIASADSPSEVAAMFERFSKAWEEDRFEALVPDREACQGFSAQRQTEELVRALEGEPSAAPFVPGRSRVPPSLRNRVSVQAGTLMTDPPMSKDRGVEWERGRVRPNR